MIMFWHKRKIWGTLTEERRKREKTKGHQSSKTMEEWKFILRWSRQKSEPRQEHDDEEMTKKYYDHCQPDRQLMVHTYYRPLDAAVLSLRVERHLLEFFSEVDNFFPSSAFVASGDIYHISSAFFGGLPWPTFFRFVIYLFTYAVRPTVSLWVWASMVE